MRKHCDPLKEPVTFAGSLVGEVNGLHPPGRPRSSVNDAALHDCQKCRMSRPYRNAQDRLLCRHKTCSAHTQLIMSRKASRVGHSPVTKQETQKPHISITVITVSWVRPPVQGS